MSETKCVTQSWPSSQNRVSPHKIMDSSSQKVCLSWINKLKDLRIQKAETSKRNTRTRWAPIRTQGLPPSCNAANIKWATTKTYNNAKLTLANTSLLTLLTLTCTTASKISLTVTGRFTTLNRPLLQRSPQQGRKRQRRQRCKWEAFRLAANTTQGSRQAKITKRVVSMTPLTQTSQTTSSNQTCFNWNSLNWTNSTKTVALPLPESPRHPSWVTTCNNKTHSKLPTCWSQSRCATKTSTLPKKTVWAPYSTLKIQLTCFSPTILQATAAYQLAPKLAKVLQIPTCASLILEVNNSKPSTQLVLRISSSIFIISSSSKRAICWI